jgi:guanine deaminase
VRGALVHFRADPFLTDPHDALVHEPDGVVVCRDGKIVASGPAETVLARLGEPVEVRRYPGCLISPGFVDTHVHYVQTGMIGACGKPLLDWLNDHTFVEEQALADRAAADAMAETFVRELLRNGTTTALVFCAVYPQSVDALFEAAGRRNLRIAAGKVLMDRNAPAALLDTAQSGYDDSKALIERWHGRGRSLYAITPRFAGTSSPAQLEAAAALWREHPGVLMQTHVSENLEEIAWIASLFPDRRDYFDVYAHHGLAGPGAVFAHGVHLSEREFGCVHETGSALSHCPTSNLFLGSGLFRLHEARRADRPVKVGMGTDIGAGTSFSMLQTLNEAYKVAQLTGHPLGAVKALWLATAGGAGAMGLEDRIGSLQPGMEADFVVLDPAATPLLAYRSARAASLEELLSVLMILGDDRAVRATYAAGVAVHERA